MKHHRILTKLKKLYNYIKTAITISISLEAPSSCMYSTNQNTYTVSIDSANWTGCSINGFWADDNTATTVYTVTSHTFN